MEILLAVLLGGGCAAVGAWLIRRRRSAAAPAPAVTDVDERGLDRAQPGDVVIEEGRDWIVVGGVRLGEGTAHPWTECRLLDGEDERWLVVPADADEAVIIGRSVPDPGVGKQPSEALEHEGRVYRLSRHGEVSAAPRGDLAGHAASDWAYWDYERPGDHRAWIRRAGPSWLYVFGRRTPRHLIRFLPGTGSLS